MKHFTIYKDWASKFAVAVPATETPSPTVIVSETGHMFRVATVRAATADKALKQYYRSSVAA